MKRSFLILFFLSVTLLSGFGQNTEIRKQTEVAQDTLSPVETYSYSKLMSEIGNNIFRSDSLDKAMNVYIENNIKRTSTGYRLRIYFDNKQNARTVSEEIANDFVTKYPDIPVFRVYTNPYFKVTVGNFRSKSDALKFLNEIKGFYPSVFLVKETFVSAPSATM